MSRHAFGITLVLSSIVAVSSLDAQVRQPGTPVASRAPLGAEIHTVLVESPAHEILRQQELQAPIGPLRYGVVLPTHVDVTAEGSYQATEDGTLVFRVRIGSPGAYSVGLEFSQFDLPKSGKVFIYDEDLDNVFGAYDQSNRIPTGEFVIEPFPGESAILEYSQSIDEPTLGAIVVRAVIHDYKDVFRLERELDGQNDTKGGDGTEGGCTLVDVNCPAGDPYPLQKRATVRTIFGGGLCSGCLINNTLSDGKKYVYTANHCGQGTTTVFRFNYQTAGCATGSVPNQNVSGATLLGNDVDTDGRLLQITGAIPTNFNPYFAGWSRATQNLTFGMSMHHPSGGVKKISIDTNGGGQVNVNFAGIGVVKCWREDFQTGGTLGGSSGGPLFDQNNRIRGALTGGPDNPCETNYYGRFYTFWLETSIATFLDPNASGVTFIDGFDPNGGAPQPPTITTVSPSSVKAFQPPVVTLTGTNFTGTSQVTVGGTALLPPFGFQVVNGTTITFTPPAPAALGAANVTVTNAVGTSAAKTLTYTETQPLAMSAPVILLNGQNATFSWGGKVNQITFFNFGTTNTTVIYNGQPFLLYLASIPWVNTDAAGLGSFTAPVSGAPVGLFLYTQVMTVAPPGTNPASVQLSNIGTSQVVF